MSTRISFNKPQGQPIHLNNNFASTGQPSSTFYQSTALEPNATKIAYNPVPSNYYQPTFSGNVGAKAEPSAFYQSNQITSPPQRETIAIERERVEVKEIERPQFQKVYNVNPPHKKLGPEEDPPSKSSCCHPCWLVLAAILGIAAITLALLFGLGVIGSSSNNPTASVIIGKPSATTSTTSTSTSTSSISSASGTIPTGVTSVSSTGGTSSGSGTSSTSTSSLSTGVQPASISPIQVPPTTVATTPAVSTIR